MTLLSFPLVSTPDDGLVSETSEDQAEVEAVISKLVREYQDDCKEGKKPVLERQKHIEYLKRMLGGFPAAYVALDASRPWLVYWIVHSLGLLGAELDALTRQRAISTLSKCRPTPEARGGFGGGPGQRPHLATSYAAVLALAYVGNSHVWGSEGVIDRQEMHDWLLSLKQPDGSFVMHLGGEVDVRGAYCALTIATLLNILTPDLMAGTASFAASCQTYEGGLASASHPFLSGKTRPALGEAHGGYAFCALATHFMLVPFPERHNGPFAQQGLDIPRLTRWAAHMQALPIEGGGFRGRTNKLVDGCYSWWNGGLWALLEALMQGEGEGEVESSKELFDREALQGYVLVAAQDKRKGGLRDKPGKWPDAYHTCYNLSGLSASQHQLLFSTALRDGLIETFDHQSSLAVVKGKNESDEAAQKRIALTYAHALAWRENVEALKTDAGNEVEATHPVFNIPLSRAHVMLDFYYDQPEEVLSAV